MSGPPVLIAAPGAGLGHLVRSCAVALRLAERGLAARIVTNSPYAEGLARLTGCAIDRLPDRPWREQAPAYAAHLRPRLIVLDCFPLGVRGEWKDVGPPPAGFVYLARRIQFAKYLSALNLTWDPRASTLERVILAEPLAPDHAALLDPDRTFTLPGRIRLPESVAGPPVPPELSGLLATGRLWLIVHSGPERETRSLIARARAEMERLGPGELAVISARPIHEPGVFWFEYFPAARLFPRAFRVVSGAGYNLMAEMAPFPDRHLAVPFARKYDDQASRLFEGPGAVADGGMMAAELIEKWME
jgi:hypothetical protein